MSHDIILLKPASLDVEDLQNLDEVLDMGSEAFVAAALSDVFPGCLDGFFAHGEIFTLEASLAGDPVTSLHLALRFGQAWSDDAFDEIQARLARLCQALQASAFSVDDNSLIVSAHRS
ncbi:hypothetical protein IAE35_21625 [Pseudomonas sp. S75]|uniref:hypothetical protein n=1 Tax=unclassified Pseudomonas TaxID=196821 RepID=UPI001907F53D|nr:MULTISPECIES: hypothetical protein [unclassified Pseudomonas]MBJ9978117.1 hypothetical protein [Pseudomonas sp. S30]MBK0155948.1 hypothetical protein [Pseudomonas sp. S75]